jgi:hypothetical protein
MKVHGSRNRAFFSFVGFRNRKTGRTLTLLSLLTVTVPLLSQSHRHSSCTSTVLLVAQYSLSEFASLLAVPVSLVRPCGPIHC